MKRYIGCDIRKWVASLFVVSAAILFAGCGGGGGGGGSSASTVNGTAATGAPIAGAIVTLTGANGVTVSATTSAMGNFSVNAANLTLPIVLFVENGDNDHFSIAFTHGTVNITPLTTMALSMAFDSVDLAGLLAAWGDVASTIDPGDLMAAIKTINANLAAIYGDAALDETRYNFFNTAFVADGTGFDGLLDAINAVSCTITDGIPIVYTCAGGAFNAAFNMSIDTSTIFPYGDISFAIVPDSTWSYTFSGSVNGTALPAETILDWGSFAVPTTLDDVYWEYGGGTIYDQESGITTVVSLTSVSLSSTGDGGIGSTVVVRVKYKIVVSGGDLPAPQTVSFVYTDTYTRTSPPPI